MSTIKLIDPITDPRWDKFVESHPFGWICHLSGWKQVLEKSFKHMKGYYFARMDNLGKNIEAALPIFEVRSWLTGRRLVSIPFASLSDPLVSSREDMGEFLEATIKLSQELKSSYIEIRALASPSFIHDNRFGKSSFYKHHYLLLKTDPENLKKKFHRTCVKQRISRAIKSNLKVKVAKDEYDLERFYRLHMITRRRLGLPTQPFRFFKSLWEIFSPSERMMLLLAEENGNAISGIILFKFKDRVSAEFAASDEKFRDMSPNHYLFWEAIKLAYAEEYKIFDFGRTSPLNKSLMDFKMRWGTEVVDLPQFFYPKEACLQNSKMEESGRYKLAKYLTAKAPDFAQQLIGKFFYCHLG